MPPLVWRAQNVQEADEAGEADQDPGEVPGEVPGEADQDPGEVVIQAGWLRSVRSPDKPHRHTPASALRRRSLSMPPYRQSGTSSHPLGTAPGSTRAVCR